ncbi:MAG: hypothetical protein LBH33_03645 [Endomicrobium sp.]|jgi:hypothetical protein|nr:hypothetical protein [Endomicrobium sp.]
MVKKKFVVLFLTGLFISVSKAEQTVDVYNSIINQNIAGNGQGDKGKSPFGQDVTYNTLNVGNINIDSSPNIMGAFTTNNDTFLGNVLNVNGIVSSPAYIFLYGCFNSSTYSDANNNIVNIAKNTEIVNSIGTTISAAIAKGNAISNKINIFPDVSINANELLNIIAVRNTNNQGDSNLQISNNVINISENVSLKGNSINILAAAISNTGSSPVNSLYITENTITLSKNVVLDASEINIQGVKFYSQPPSVLELSNNMLTFHANKEYRVTRVGNFTNYKFYLYEGIKAGDTVLSFASGVSFDPTVTIQSLNLDGVFIDIEMTKENTISLGDSITIMHCDAGFVNFSTNSNLTIEKYSTPLFEKKSKINLNLDPSRTNIIATLLEEQLVLNERSKQYSQGRGAGIASVNQGGDLLAGRGIEELEKITGQEIVPFGAVQFGKSKYKTGSVSNISGYGVIAGIGKNVEMEEDKVFGGVFFERGGGL